MGNLGVSQKFSIQKNLEIILEQYKKEPRATLMRTNYLSRFTWVGHKKGENYPSCQCLRCLGLNAIKFYKLAIK